MNVVAVKLLKKGMERQMQKQLKQQSMEARWFWRLFQIMRILIQFDQI